jgi:hypothetical protein
MAKKKDFGPVLKKFRYQSISRHTQDDINLQSYNGASYEQPEIVQCRSMLELMEICIVFRIRNMWSDWQQARIRVIGTYYSFRAKTHVPDLIGLVQI